MRFAFAVFAAVSFLLGGCRTLLGIEEPFTADGGVPDPDSDSNMDTVPSIGFASGSSIVDETVGTIQVDVVLSAAASVPASVDYALAGGTAQQGSDYTFTAGTLQFAPGETSKSIELALLVDDLEETDEDIVIRLSNATNATLGTVETSEHVISISSDILPRLRFTMPSSNGLEDATTSAMVEIDIVSDTDVTFMLSLSGNASAADHAVPTGEITIPAGQTSVLVPLGIVDDPMDEDDESFTITLENPADAVIGQMRTHTRTIVDNDDPPMLSLDPPSVPCNEGMLVSITGMLSTPSGKQVSVSLNPVFETATGQDMTLPNGIAMMFPPGSTTQTIDVFCTDDTLDEFDETFRIMLGPIMNATPGNAATVVVIADNDEQSMVFFEAPTAQANEGGFTNTMFNIVVRLDKASGKQITVPFATTGTATPGSNNDYTLSSASLVFDPGQISGTLVLTVRGDFNDELDETVIIGIQATLTNATRGMPNSHTHTIKNDD